MRLQRHPNPELADGFQTQHLYFSYFHHLVELRCVIHFFLRFSKNAGNSLFARYIAESGAEHRIIAGDVQHEYRHNSLMMLVGRLRVALFGIDAAFKSLVKARPAPRVVVLGSHIEALIVGAFRRVLGHTDTRIVLLGFILTPRQGRLHSTLRDIYFRRVFSVVDLAVVHSRAEAESYSQIFRDFKTRFVFISWGTYVAGLEELRQTDEPHPSGAEAYVLSAGRSGRDYRTLTDAFHNSDRCLHVICDRAAALEDCVLAPNIEVLESCYGDAYLRELWHAHCVVIPLAVQDISAGQMVLVQAMAMGKPVVITRTTTTAEYVTHEHDALFVEPGDPGAINAAVERLFADPELCERLGRNAETGFRERFSLPAFVDSLMREIRTLDPAAGRVNPT